MPHKSTEKAFRWIVEVLGKYDVPFQITGGLAAKIYGSDRPLADIDIDIPEGQFKDILSDVKDYVIFGPERFTDNNWDLLLMTLKYEGQEIDICSDKVKMRDSKSGEWKEYRTNFSESENHDVYGISVPVIEKEDLIEYKTLLQRPVDVEDVNAMTK